MSFCYDVYLVYSWLVAVMASDEACRQLCPVKLLVYIIWNMVVVFLKNRPLVFTEHQYHQPRGHKYALPYRLDMDR